MGNVEAAVVRNVDKRTSRREHRNTFAAAVERFRVSPFEAPTPPCTTNKTSRRFVHVCVRKRPIFKHELDQGEFDVVTCLPARVVVHDARMHPDMVNMFMNHHDFTFDETFGETADNDTVYAGTAQKLVQNALCGTSGTVMMYGQTGSGKTYTMNSVYERAAADLFDSEGDRNVMFSFVELSGDVCSDMLNGGAVCNLVTSGDGTAHPYPCVEVPVHSASEFLALLNLATKLRATAATGVHDQSSRSHAVCRIFIECPGGDGEASLTLVDLAGSEHRIDNAEHNAERRKEGAKINASLAALKECIRGASKGSKFVAFRQNRLTQMLRGCFSNLGQHDTVVIATVSPSSKDTEHSMNTLRHACIMDGKAEESAGQSAHTAGGAVTKEKLGAIDVTGIARERRAKTKVNQDANDEWGKPRPPPSHQAKQSNTVARASIDRRAVRTLPQPVFDALMAAREIAHTERQSRRQKERFDRLGRQAAEMEAAAAAQAEAEAAEAAAVAPAAAEGKTTSRGVPPQPHDGASHGSTGDTGAVPSAATSPTEQDERRAKELWECFLANGRGGRAWRKNDLRLLNSFVVPKVFGCDARIDWAYPNAALDQLEEYAREMPPPQLRHGVQTKPASQFPPRVPSRGASKCNTPAGGKAGIAEPYGQPQRSARSASPAQGRRGGRSPVEPSAPPSAGSVRSCPAPSTHSESVRARREALEQERRRSLQKALEKREPSGREAEMADLENKLQGGLSAAAAAGVKKRLAALKAQEMREQRAAAKAQARTQHDFDAEQ